MSSPEIEKFEVTEEDLANEFNPNRRTWRMTKKQAIYGIWADPESDEERPVLGRGKKDYTTPVSFVSGGVKQGDKIKKPGEQTDDSDSDEEFDIKSLQEIYAEKKEKSRQKSRPLRFSGLKHDDNEFGSWEKHTRGIGQKLLEKMGFERGKGLGKSSQGILAPIQAMKRKHRAGLEFHGSERTLQSLRHFPVVDSEEEEEKEFQEELHQWKRQPSSNNRKPKYTYKTAQDVIESGGKKKKVVQQSELAKVKVIDMTGREKRVLSGYHAICQRHDKPDEEEEVMETPVKERNAFDMPELIHNLNILVDMSEEEIIQNDRKLRHERDMVINMKHEKERLDTVCEQEAKLIDRLQKVVDIVESCEKRSHLDSENPLTLMDCVATFKELQDDFYEEYKMYDLGVLAVALVFPIMKKYFSEWEPLSNPSRGLNIVREWQYILEDNNHQYVPDITNMDVYQRLIWDVWLPCVRTTILKWPVRDCDPVIELLETWMPVIPSWILENIQDQLVLPRLMQEVENWNPLIDTMPIHAWLHPWLPLMGDKLEPLYAPIRHKLANALTSWHPSDSSAKVILQPWVSVFKPGHMEAFLVKNILPKLGLCLQEFVINPHQQILDPWNWVMSWRDITPIHHMIGLLEKAFFPKWLQVLCTWLGNMPNYEEVTNWYLGWKSQFPEQCLTHPSVIEQFNRALDIMNRAASGHFQPGAKENMAYFAHTERRQMGTQPLQTLPPSIITTPPPSSSSASPEMRDFEGARSVSLPYPSSFRDLVEKMANEKGLLFVPIPGKTHEAKQVYRLGSIMMYLDRNVIFTFENQQWVPTSLQNLIDKAQR